MKNEASVVRNECVEPRCVPFGTRAVVGLWGDYSTNSLVCFER